MRRRRRLPIIIPRLDDPEGVGADERDEHLMLLEAARHQLEVEFTATLAVADDQGDHSVFGHPSSVAYLKSRLGMAGGRAHRHVKQARAALRHKATFAAWKLRQISTDQAELLFKAAQKLPDKYPQGEAVLLEIIGDDYAETKQMIEYWTQTVDKPGTTLDLEDQLARRFVEATRRSNGMVTGEFALPQLAGETFLTALDALLPPPIEGDKRTTVQRRADALDDLARSFLDGAETPSIGGEKPHLSVHVDIDGVEGRAGGLHETEDGHVLPIELVEQIACDASVRRIVFRGRSEVIDVGRATRVVPAALRRAVIARDRRCVWSRCGRPPKWADVHHLVPWSQGGATSLDNLCLLCRYHHGLVHLGILPEADSVLDRPLLTSYRRTT